MAEPRKVCCCEAATWARVIAWLQIVLNVLAALLVILALAGVSGLAITDKNEEGQDKQNYGMALAILVIALVMCIVGVIFGIILLKGTNNRRPALLKVWMVFTAIVLVWAIIEAALSSSNLASKIVTCVLKIVIYGFGIWVVNTLKREIETEAEGQKY